MITTAALCCGIAAFYYAQKSGTRDYWDRALLMVAAAAILDALDGRAARLLRVSSPFGATLDSIADFVSFGLAPAFLLFRWKLDHLELFGRSMDPLGFMIAAFYALCAAIRLARFTSMAKKGRGSPWGPHFFLGLPSPAAAGCVLIPLLLDTSKRLDLQLPGWFVLLHTLTMGLLMVSRLPMYSLKSVRVSRRAVVPLMLAVGAVVFFATRDPWLTLAGLSSIYLLSIPVSIALAKPVAPAPAPAPQA